MADLVLFEENRAYVIEKGSIQYQGTMEALEADDHVREAYLTV